MSDPFQNVDAAGEDFIKAFADSMDARQSDPVMEQIVVDYLGRLRFAPGSLTVEVGAGAGAVSRRIAAKAQPEQVVGFEPSTGFVAEAKARAGDQDNLSFEVADGMALPLKDGSVDNLILHTVLTHVTEPTALITEARRVLQPGGTLVVCDADFSKATLGNYPGDPLDTCAQAFVRDFVTDPYIVAKLRPMLHEADMDVAHFEMHSRVVANNMQMMTWVEETGKRLIANGDIGQQLADALCVEYLRRMKSGTLYGYQVFATAIATKP